MKRAFGLFFGCIVMVPASVLSCARASPPEPDVIDPTTAPLAAPFDAGAASAMLAAISNNADGGGATTMPAQGDAATTSTLATSDDAGIDPGTLPQTNEKPHASGAAWDARVAALFEAIKTDNPDLALPFFFPVHAYEQVKAIPNPAGDWRRRLVAAYVRDIHKLHARLGDDATKATFKKIEVPEDRARWVDPGEESNKLGYYRVYGTRMWYEIDGKSRSLDVTSLISWRGEWYVVHLSGFK